MLRSSLPALQSASATLVPWPPLGLADSILGFACSNIDNELGELVRVAWAFGHVRILPHPAPSRHSPQFQTETLPPGCMSCNSHFLQILFRPARAPCHDAGCRQIQY